MTNSSHTNVGLRLGLAIAAGLAIAMGLALSAGAGAISSGISGSSVAPLGMRASASTAEQRKSGSHVQAPPQSADTNSGPQGAHMTEAKGTFEVKLEPQGESDKATGSTMARMSIDKTYHGDLEGSAKGTMLTAGTDVKGSAGYVAIERVTGTLNGKTGSFVLQHSGTLTRGAPVQNITVVPDSGTGQLSGITGKFLVIIADGKHSYQFDYALPAAH